jgi:hypothetical protein
MKYLKNLIAPSKIKDLLIEIESDVNPQDINSETPSHVFKISSLVFSEQKLANYILQWPLIPT